MNHKKIVCHQTKLGPLVHGDYYRFGDGGTPCPLLLYVGGAISAEDYHRRLESEPLPVLDQFNLAWDALGQPNVDLLILPCPPVEEGGEPTFRQDFFSTLIFSILPATENSRPHALGLVGYSLGASLATFTALTLGGARALATLGGYAMAEAGRESSCVGGVASRRIAAFCSFDDRAYMENLSFVMFLQSHEVELEVEMRPGGHEFADYCASGAARDAFGFVLKNLTD